MQHVVRTALQIAAIIFTLFALCVMGAALFTQSWQVIYAPEIDEYYLRGLFEECAWGPRFGRGTDMLCTFTMYDQSRTLGGWNMLGGQNPYYGSGQNPYYGSGTGFAGGGSFNFEPYRLTTLICISLSMIFGLMGFIFEIAAGRNIVCAVLASVVMVLCELSASVGIICFYRNALDPINMVALIVTRPAEQNIGYSFWIGVGGCLAFLVAMALTLGMTALIVIARREGDRGRMSGYEYSYEAPISRRASPYYANEVGQKPLLPAYYSSV